MRDLIVRGIKSESMRINPNLRGIRMQVPVIRFARYVSTERIVEALSANDNSRMIAARAELCHE